MHLLLETVLPAALVLATGVVGLQDVGGPSCSSPNSACSYSYTSSSGGTMLVEGFCSPITGMCADNGALCSTDSQCYNTCGDNGICGGPGALCDTSQPFIHNQNAQACETFTSVCPLDGEGDSATCIPLTGVSLPATISSLPRRRRQVMLERLEDMPQDVRSLLLCKMWGTDYTSCPISGGAGGFECVNTRTLELCGGCSLESGAVDCSSMPGVEEVACIAGRCFISSCDFGAGYGLSPDMTECWKDGKPPSR
ncbi:hypothetical protein T439DRAFT_320138 [Meredithblackwellia eburnea MCA 4105]